MIRRPGNPIGSGPAADVRRILAESRRAVAHWLRQGRLAKWKGDRDLAEVCERAARAQRERYEAAKRVVLRNRQRTGAA